MGRAMRSPASSKTKTKTVFIATFIVLLLCIIEVNTINAQTYCSPSVTLTGTSGQIADRTGGGSTYQASSTCSWTWSTTEPAAEFRLTVTYFNTSYQYTYLQIFDSATSNTNRMIGYMTGEYTSEVTFVSQSREAMILFSTDSTPIASGGFNASWSVTTPMYCSSGTTTTLSGSTGSFTSQTNGLLYKANSACSWVITCPAGYDYVELNVTDPSGTTGPQIDADFDYLIVYDGTDAATDGYLATFSGHYSQPEIVSSSSPSVRVSFNSDDTAQDRGFAIDYLCRNFALPTISISNAVLNGRTASIPSLSINRGETITTARLVVSVSVTNGSISLPESLIPSLEIYQGTGTRDQSVVFTGAQKDLDQAIAQLTYNVEGPASSTGVSAYDSISVSASLDLPSSCADIRKRVPLNKLGIGRVGGARYKLFANNNFMEQYTVLCTDYFQQAGRPVGYLELGAGNVMTYGSTSENPGNTTVTTYSKVRFDTDRMLLNPYDNTFATTTWPSGFIPEVHNHKQYVPFGFAENANGCADTGSTKGVISANFDSTPFALGSMTFTNQPNGQVFETDIAANRKSVTVRGCGYDGGAYATPVPPFTPAEYGFILTHVNCTNTPVSYTASGTASIAVEYNCDNIGTCGGLSHGQCWAQDTCLCRPQWNHDATCSQNFWDCSSVNDCSNRGECVDQDHCVCDDGYSGNDCSLILCDGIPHTDENVCSGQGTCTAPDTCDCEYGFSGPYCNLLNPAISHLNATATSTTASASTRTTNLPQISASAWLGIGFLVQVSISTNGYVSLSNKAGLTFVVGDGYMDSTMVFNGDAQSVNAALTNYNFTFANDAKAPYTDSVNITLSIDYPSSCKEIKDRIPGAQNGTYTLYYANNDNAAVPIYCHDMDTADPKMYLTLDTTDGKNRAVFGLNNNTGSICPLAVDTTYNRIRIIDLINFEIDRTDNTFAYTPYNYCRGKGPVPYYMPYGSAGSCAGCFVNKNKGFSNMNLRGTPFRFQSNQEYSVSGYHAFQQYLSVSSDFQEIYVEACGSCGSADPVTTSGDSALRITPLVSYPQQTVVSFEIKVSGTFSCNPDCGSNGICISDNQCLCLNGYTGTDCSTPPYCNGIPATADDVCSGNGQCAANSTCSCYSGWTGDNCQTPTCFDTPLGSGVCSGHGSCIGPNTCQCNSGWTGPKCDVPMCFGQAATLPEACSGHGNCTAPDTCSCDSGYTDTQCATPVCFGIRADLTASVCNGNGQCVGPDNCTCSQGYSGPQCSQTKCFGRDNSDPLLCSGHGDCVSVDKCECAPGWTGTTCSIPICFNVNGSSSSACFGRGQCIAPDTCNCTGYSDAKCIVPICYGLAATDPLACGGQRRGICEAPNTCVCQDRFAGSQCEQNVCGGKYLPSEVCNNGRGNCTDFITHNKCVCRDGYSGDDCSITTCFGIPQSSSNVCSGRGTCSAPNTCTCRNIPGSQFPAYFGDQCQYARCSMSLPGNAPNACSGNGVCYESNICTCNAGWAGASCNRTALFIPSTSLANSTCWPSDIRAGQQCMLQIWAADESNYIHYPGEAVTYSVTITQLDNRNTTQQYQPIDHHNGTYSVLFTIQKSTYWSFQIKMNTGEKSEVIGRNGSVTAFVKAADISPTKTVALLPENIFAGINNTFIINSYDIYGNLRQGYQDSFFVKIYSADRRVRCRSPDCVKITPMNNDKVQNTRAVTALGGWTNRGNGSYAVTFSVPKTGAYDISVGINMDDGSQYLVTDAARVTAVEYVPDKNNDGNDGQPLSGGIIATIVIVVVGVPIVLIVIIAVIAVVVVALVRARRAAEYEHGIDSFRSGVELPTHSHSGLMSQTSAVSSMIGPGSGVSTSAVGDNSKPTIRIDAGQLEVKFEDIQLLEKVGQGAFGTVYKAKWVEDIVAFKKFNFDAFADQDENNNLLADFEHEVAILAELRHNNILMFMGACLQPPNIGIITEFMDNGSLYDLLHKEEKQMRLKWNKKLDIATDIAKGMDFLHRKKFIHRDLKSLNILMDKNLNAKVCDFGLSVMKERMENMLTANVGTPLWMAPEVTLGLEYGTACDVYSFAMIMYELLAEKLPYWEEPNKMKIHIRACREHDFRPSIPPLSLNPLMSHMQEEYCELMRFAWLHEPEQRPLFKDIIQRLKEMYLEVDSY